MLTHSLLVTRPLAAPLKPVAPIPAARPRSLVILAAKKKGGGGGGGKGNKKGPGSLASPPKPAAPYLSTPVIMQNLLLIESHFRKVGRPLFTEEIEISDVARVLWEAPFPVLSHDDTADDGGPRFVYANRAALDLFEAEWDELIGTPSRRSAEPVTDIQEDRSAALTAAMENGFIDNYEGNRISAKGTKFRISRATVFNVEAPSGDVVGQAAVIRAWEYEDGRKGGELAEEEAAAMAEAAAGEAPSAEALAAAEEAVTAQAAAVRELKEVQGLKNSSEEVQAAVAELQAKKEALEALRAAAAAAAAAS